MAPSTSHPLQRKIGRLRARVRRLVVVYALSWIIGAVLVTAVLLGLADYLVRFQDRGIRVICTLALLGVLGWTCYRFLFVGLTARLSDVELARRLQRRFPKLGDSLASSVEFIAQPEDDPTAGSAALRRAVIAQTTAETEPVDFRRAVRPGPAWRAAVILLAILLVVLVVVVLDPLSSRLAAARLVNPFGDVAWPQTYHLVLCREVTKVARGQAFEVEVVDAGGIRLPSDVRIHYRFENPDGSAEETEPMRFVDGRTATRGEGGAADPRRQNGVMVARRENVTRPFSYRIEGGDDRSMPWIPVEVLEPPAVEALSIKLFPPEYTGWPPEKAERHIRALEGTRVEISATATKPLQSAVFCLEGGRQKEASPAGPQRRSFRTEFVVEKSGAYWFRLTDAEGITGGTDARWEIRAVPDTPPSVSIEQPNGNLFVTAGAEVPRRIAAKDNLAVHRIELKLTRSDRAAGDEVVLPLHIGPDRVEAQPSGLSAAESGHQVVATDNWQLAEMNLEPGTQITFYATASDYRPSSGQSEPRRLTVITPEELAERLAARQATILAELSRVLEMQQQSRRQVGELEIRLGEVGHLSQLDVDHLRGAELNQLQATRTLTSPGEGVPMHVLGLLADLENNKVDSPDVRRQMRALLEEIDRLGREPLPIIGRELTSAIKAAQIRLQDRPSGKPPERPGDEAPKPDPLVAKSLDAAGKHQDHVVASLQQMLDELGRWGRYRRFHARISQLLRDQRELVDGTKEVGRRTLTKDPEDLLPQESADLKILARRQFGLAGDLDEVRQGMQQAAAEIEQSDPLFAQTVADALVRAAELAVSGQMRSAGGSIQRNQIGQAIRQQEKILQDLQEILDILANRREHELTRLIKQLREAEADLAEMARREEGLRKQIDEAENLPDQQQRRSELERLGRQQEQLQQEAERMARRLERLLAESAAQTTSQAAEKMHQAGQSARQGQGRGAAKQAQAAKQDLDEARRQVAQRRRQAEAELAMEQMAQLQETLQGMHGQQSQMLRETVRLDRLFQDQGQLTRAQAASLHALARGQSLLQSETVALTEKLVGAEVFNLALSGAASEMGRAAALLDRRRTGAATQQAEQNALRRLDQLLEALEPVPPEGSPDESGEGGSGGAGKQGAPPGNALQTLAELKLLKLLQQEVNARTQALEETFGSAATLTGDALRQYVQLGEEQGRLADLLLNLIRPQENPEDSLEVIPGVEPGAEEDDLLLPREKEALQ